MTDMVIASECLGKKYVIGHRAEGGRYVALRDVLARNARELWHKSKDLVRGRPLLEGDSREEVWALKDVSFEIRRGETVGIIGRNGAGKSTLLKILSRITEPSAGRVTVRGRVASLLEVGTGFHPELTGRENIYLNGAILGMARAEIRRKFAEIVAFAETEKYLDTPVKRYSSGMHVRLAFAVAAHLEPEILLVDEVLAVGDAAFQKKCLGKMGDVAQAGRTVLFVSHNMAVIRELCPTCLWLDGGRVRQAGSTAAVIDSYLREADRSGGTAACAFEEDPEKEFQLRAARLLDDQGHLTQHFDCDRPIIIEFVCQVRRRLPGLFGYLSLSKMDGTTVLVSDSYDAAPNPLEELPVGLHVTRVTIPARTLGAGQYAVYVNFASPAGARGFNVDAPGTVLTFGLEDQTSRRGNNRLGHFSTLLPWEVSSLS